jgi:hypothetical protein
MHKKQTTGETNNFCRFLSAVKLQTLPVICKANNTKRKKEIQFVGGQKPCTFPLTAYTTRHV